MQIKGGYEEEEPALELEGENPVRTSSCQSKMEEGKSKIITKQGRQLRRKTLLS